MKLIKRPEDRGAVQFRKFNLADAGQSARFKGRVYPCCYLTGS